MCITDLSPHKRNKEQHRTRASHKRKSASARPAPLVSIQVCNPDVSSRALGGKPHKTTQSDTHQGHALLYPTAARARGYGT